MRSPFLLAGLAILGTALAVLLLFGQNGSVAGLDPDSFARLAGLAAVALLVGAGLLASRHRANMRLWHAAAWLAILVALIAAYSYYPA